MIIFGTDNKQVIPDDPLLRHFKCDIHRDGYLNSSYTKLQIEDVLDIITLIFPQFDFMFLFDQSSGHMKCREDGLIVNKMNSSYGGAATKIHDTVVKEI